MSPGLGGTRAHVLSTDAASVEAESKQVLPRRLDPTVGPDPNISPKNSENVGMKTDCVHEQKK